jgi:hypothetical protein
MKTTTPLIKTSTGRLFLRPGYILIFAFVCFALAPMVDAQGPDTDGAIPGANNGEGIGVLVNRTSGVWNTGTGFEALNHLTAGNQNTATGLRALSSDTNGGFNTATGVFSRFSNTSGFFKSATGAYSLANNTLGNRNTANGYGALYFNTEGYQNTATGFGALYKNTTGFANTANGYLALANHTTGVVNTAIGNRALTNNTTGTGNTAVGSAALLSNATGANNTALGRVAGGDITGSGNVCIGQGVGGEALVNDTTWIRNVYDSVASERQVYVNSDNKIGTLSSSRRYKEDIKPMDTASETLFALKPVTFRYKKEIDRSRALSFGLIAEEVARISPDLITRDEEGQPQTVRYEAINAMLLNEFLKEHRKVEEQDRKMRGQDRKIKEQEATIAQLRKDFQTTVAQLTARLEEQASLIQKVSGQIELNGAAQRTVFNDQ